MTRKNAFMWIEAGLCILLVLILSLGAIGIYHEGLARKAEDPLTQIYTVEAVVKAIVPAIPVLILAIIMAIAAFIAGKKDEKASVVEKSGVFKRKKNSTDSYVLPALSQKGKLLRRILLAIAVICLLAGVWNGSMTDVWNKARMICMECIGMG